jgi:hypothetical protein
MRGCRSAPTNQQIAEELKPAAAHKRPRLTTTNFRQAEAARRIVGKFCRGNSFDVVAVTVQRDRATNTSASAGTCNAVPRCKLEKCRCQGRMSVRTR